MKVLYAIQGTGNGHLSRARDIIPVLREYCDADILVSGTQADVDIPFPVKYQLDGMSFVFGKKGGVDVWNTYVRANIKRFRDEIEELPIEDYDLVINDFEPVSAWACMLRKVPCISLSHQGSLLKKEVPKPRGNNIFGKSILRFYAPSHQQVGLHFCRYSSTIFTPVIRQEIRFLPSEDKGHYTVYLPSYDDQKIIDVLKEFPDVKWQIFSKHNTRETNTRNFSIRPISNVHFIKSLASARGVLCGAGFETPAEALFLGKKLMVIPMKSQYEQQCNAEALRCMGVPVLPKLRKKHSSRIREWIDSDYKVQVAYPDDTVKIISHTLEMVYPQVRAMLQADNDEQHSLDNLEMPTLYGS
jgi:uncharacterized protein (TIGR00661 family)